MTSPAADPGLFGPDSITWRIHGDPSMSLGGLRALLLQALHPLAMAGVAQHSDFQQDPWGRLFRTAEYVGVITYGTVPEAQRAGARVRGIHRRLRGIEPESGRSYRVDDPDLLTWVHCCEVDSFLTTFARSGGRLEPGDADLYLGEQTAAAELVGLDPERVPGSVREMRDYFAGVRPELRLTAAGSAAARFILFPPMPGWVQVSTPAVPAWAGLATLAFAMLPPWARRLYRLPGLPTTDIGASLAGAAVRTGLLAVPAGVRQGPHEKAAYARLAEPATPGEPVALVA